MKLKELKVLIAQQAVRTIIESKINEVSETDTIPAARISQPATAATKYKTTIDQEMDGNTSDPVVDYHARKRIADDAKNSSLTDDQRNGAAYLNSYRSFTPDAKLSSTPVNQDEVLEYLLSYVVGPYEADKTVKPYYKYLESEQQQAAYEQGDEEQSLQTIASDDLDLVNVHPTTGQATFASHSSIPSSKTKLARKPQKLKESKKKQNK